MFSPDQMTAIGHGLARPECVLCTSDGTLHVADWRGGVTLIAPDGVQKSVLAKGDFQPKPNGIAILPEGGLLLAHLGDEDGGVYHLSPDGTVKPFLVQVDGVPLPPTNYVHVDGQNRIWITVSTRRQPRSLGYRADCNDGFIVLLDDTGARVVAEGLGYTNECLVHPQTNQLYVNETFARRLTRFDITATGDLINKTTIARFGPGTFPDGLTFDADGGIWITSIVSNRLIRVAPDGSQTTMVEDAAPEDLAHLEKVFVAGQMDRSHLANPLGRRLKNISSAAFGGSDLDTLYLGCLLGEEITSFRAPVRGLEPFHWNWTAAAKAVLP